MSEEIPRLTANEQCVLELLLEHKAEKYGLQLVEESCGVLSRNSIYVILARMQDKGLLESKPELKDPRRPGIPRRMYRATGAGVRAVNLLKQWRAFTARVRNPLHA